MNRLLLPALALAFVLGASGAAAQSVRAELLRPAPGLTIAEASLAPNAGINLRRNDPVTSGAWDTTYGVLALVQREDGRYIGSYSNYGKVNGRREGRTLIGRFYHPNDSGECPTAVQGSTNWGRFEFTFDRDGSFTGKWGWCDGEMTYGWNGTMK